MPSDRLASLAAFRNSQTCNKVYTYIQLFFWWLAHRWKFCCIRRFGEHRFCPFLFIRFFAFQVRLSGLREKFFGELFSNASATWHHEQTTAHAEPTRDSGQGGAQTLETKEGYAHLVRY